MGVQMDTRERLAGEEPVAQTSKWHDRKQAMTLRKHPSTGTGHELPAGGSDEITIRLSNREDRVAIMRLAQLDGHRALSGEAILAIVGGELRAALPLGGGDAVADPFWPTTELVEMLRVRDATLYGSGTGDRRARRARSLRACQAKSV
jgi:hypothetical protein